MKIQKQNIISYHMFELRYKAIPELFDKRGSLISFFEKKLEFPHWRVTDNQIVLADNLNEKKSKESCFMSHINCGYSVFTPDTKNYFKDKAIKFVTNFFEEDLMKTVDLLRIGLRSKFIIISEEKFESLLKKVKNDYLKIELDSNLFEGKITDIGFPIYFEDGKDSYNSNFGAMESKQIKSYFNDKEGLPDRGIYFELDYYRLEKDLAKPYDNLVTELINKYNDKEWEKFEKVINKIF